MILMNKGMTSEIKKRKFIAKADHLFIYNCKCQIQNPTVLHGYYHEQYLPKIIYVTGGRNRIKE